MENPLIARAIATIKQAIAADASLDGDKAFELYSRSCLLLTNAVKDETNTYVKRTILERVRSYELLAQGVKKRVRMREITGWNAARAGPEATPPRIEEPQDMPLSDRDVLGILYRTTGGWEWTCSHGWNSEDELHGWEGVIVNEQGRVTTLDLSENNLRGYIPTELGNLTALECLCLGNNHLTGYIPMDLGRLTALEYLLLGNNKLTGSIPPELGNLNLLCGMSLFTNELSGVIPMELGQLTLLEDFNVSSNQLSGTVPKELGNLTLLRKLWLQDNKLTGTLPRELSILDALVEMNVSGNRLTGDPASGESLEEWRLRLQGWPSSPQRGPPLSLSPGKTVRAFTSVTFRNGSVSRDRHALRVLYRETGGPQWIHNQGWGTRAKVNDWFGVEADEEGRVVKLHLSLNNLRGSLPAELGDLDHLQSLHLSLNRLDGPIPPELGRLGALQDLHVASSCLHGTIPPDLGSLDTLTDIQIGGNHLCGGPREDESVHAWKQRLQNVYGNETGSPPVESMSLLSCSSVTLKDTPPSGKQDKVPEYMGSSWSYTESELEAVEEGSREVSLRRMNSSFVDLKGVVMKTQTGVEEMEKRTAGKNIISEEWLNQAPDFQELGKLVEMANVLRKVALDKVEDDDMKAKELEFAPGSAQKVYYTTVKNGLCNAYIAASAVSSNMVSTSKTGIMGRAGKALNLFAAAAPMVPGLSTLAASLNAGDRHIQKKRVVKITALAGNVIECATLARKVALRLATDLNVDSSSDVRAQGMFGGAGVDSAGGRCDAVHGVSAEYDGADEEAVMDWFVDEVAECEAASHQSHPSKMGQQLGQAHLKTLLKAVGQNQVCSTHSMEEKVKILVGVILPSAEMEFPGKSSPAKAGPGGLMASAMAAYTASHVPSTRSEYGCMTPYFDGPSPVDTVALAAELSRLQTRVEKMEKLADASRANQSVSVHAASCHGLLFNQERHRSYDSEGEFFSRAEEREQHLNHNLSMEEYFWRENEKKAIKQEEREELETRIHDLERKLERASRRGMFSFFRKGGL